MKKLSQLLIFLLLSLLLFACIQNNTDDTNPATSLTDTAYISEPISIPHSTFLCATVYQDTLYYIINDDDSTLAADTALTLVWLPLAEASIVGDTPPILTPLRVDFPAATPDLTAPYMMLAIDSRGGIHLLLYQYDAGGAVEVGSAYWYQYDESGLLLKGLDISKAVAGGHNSAVSDFAIGEAGNPFVVKDGKFIVISHDGEAAFEVVFDGRNASLFDNDGETGILYYGAGNAYYLATVDTAAGSLIRQTKLEIDNIISQSVAKTKENTLFLATAEAVLDYDLVRHVVTERFTLADAGIAVVSNFTRLFPLSDGRVLFADRYDFDQKPFRMIRPLTEAELEVAKANEQQEKSVITVGLLGPLFDNLPQLVFAYNQANLDKQVELIEYFDNKSPYSGDWEREFYSRYDAAIFNLELDIIRGQGPDIVISRQALSWQRYAQTGIFEDLYPYLDTDSVFDWSEYYENHIRAYEIEGKLYGFPVGSSIQGLVVTEADIGDRTSWNMDEFIAFVDSFGSNATVFAHPTKTAVLNLCLYANGDILIDWSSKGVGFNRDFVIKILEFANRFIDDERHDNNSPLDLRARNGEVKVYAPGGIGELWTIHTLPSFQAVFGEPVSYIGFPAEKGNGVITHSDRLVSLTAGSSSKEAAWHFISYYLTENHMSKDSYMELLNNQKETTFRYNRDDISTIYEYRIDDEAITSFFELFMGEVQIRIYDQTIENIIKEEATSYFSGGKSLEEAVAIIENRVSVFVNESK
ncbi:MAG: extracellular solute-binding protein [Lachnospiraceae bacterium]|jgi:ABC-type glycerol-3-phosphate transport system substrate-binding protein|nr:extracellular solute-binding protein [Lachnospiraceae bacterium]